MGLALDVLWPACHFNPDKQPVMELSIAGLGTTEAGSRSITLSVVKPLIENTLRGRCEIYEILIQPEDDSFQTKEKVLAEPPHYPVRVE